MTIPRVIHQYWGGSPVPRQYQEYSNAWAEMNPDWTLYLWGDTPTSLGQFDLDNAHQWHNPREYVGRDRAEQFKSDVVRYELLRNFGGVWIDMDFEPLKPLDSWFGEIDQDRPFAAWEVPGKWAANGLMGSPQGHWFMDTLIRRLPEVAHSRRGETPTRLSGPQFMTELHFENGEPMQFLGPERFYPYLWSDLGKPKSRPPWPPECVAVHHWNGKRSRTGRWQ